MSDCNSGTKTAVNSIARQMKIRDDREMKQRFRLEMFTRNQKKLKMKLAASKGDLTRTVW